jgi:phosphoglucosamine mutase
MGVLPTPAVAYLVDVLDADLGVMLSASHNPMPDNGIKFFSRGGHKLDDAIEDDIEQRLGEPWDRPVGADVGRVTLDFDSIGRYERHLLDSIPHRLDGLTIVVDCANGASSSLAADVYGGAGATVIPIHSQPDGLNINDGCGSTHLDDLIAAVREHGADAGIAHDGDADRCLAVDGDGNVVDGDHILAIIAMAMSRRDELTGNTVVATVMANLGFMIAMRKAGISVVETGVGDRYVLEAMRMNGYVLGGEQSGHVVLSEFATTGDGMLTALHLLSEVAASGHTLAELAGRLVKLPQVLINVRGVDRTALDDSDEVRRAVLDAEAELGEDGRVLLRPSGTEPVIRVMVEAPTQAQAQAIGERLASVVSEALAIA